MIDFTSKEHYDFSDLFHLVEVLRAPGGCPWDQAQTHLSIRRNFLEEAYEACEGFDRDDPDSMCEELGDVLLQVLFHTDIERAAGRFTLDDVCNRECKKLIFRHPFPGPGLAIRILGSIDRESVRILQDADDIFISALRKYDLYDRVWQAGVILLPNKTVGVMGDERTYERAVVLRAVTSSDAMTADWADLPHEFLAEVSNDIIRGVKGVNRVCYDISSKPPATIEWE